MTAISCGPAFNVYEVPDIVETVGRGKNVVLIRDAVCRRRPGAPLRNTAARRGSWKRPRPSTCKAEHVRSSAGTVSVPDQFRDVPGGSGATGRGGEVQISLSTAKESTDAGTGVPVMSFATANRRVCR